MRKMLAVAVVLLSLTGCAAATSPTPTQTPYPTLSAAPMPVKFSFSCEYSDGAGTARFETLESAWGAARDFASCTATYLYGTETTADQDAALSALASTAVADLEPLYALCANKVDPNLAGSPDATNALILCPTHPRAAMPSPTVAPAPSATAELAPSIPPGSHRVNESVQPGTYVAESSAGFRACYWERLDSAGSIIDNNFAQGAFRVEVTISSDDFSFRSDGCGTWKLVA